MSIGHNRIKQILAEKRKKKKYPLRYMSKNDKMRLLAQGWAKEYFETIMEEGKTSKDFFQDKAEEISDFIKDNNIT